MPRGALPGRRGRFAAGREPLRYRARPGGEEEGRRRAGRGMERWAGAGWGSLWGAGWGRWPAWELLAACAVIGAVGWLLRLLDRRPRGRRAPLGPTAPPAEGSRRRGGSRPGEGRGAGAGGGPGGAGRPRSPGPGCPLQASVGSGPGPASSGSGPAAPPRRSEPSGGDRRRRGLGRW